MKFTHLYCAVFVAFLGASCRPGHDQGVNKFSDPVLVKIYDLKDRRLADSLYQYLGSAEEKYRFEAAMAFASIQDSSAVDALGKMLMDQSSLVRRAAAFSLGQSRSSSAEVLLAQAFTNEQDASVRDELIEAYGKVAKAWQVRFTENDPSLPERYSWGMYRLGLRGFANPRLDSIAAILLRPTFKETTRLGAAHYFSRTSKGFDGLQRFIIRSAIYDSSAYVRMASTLALGKVISDSALTAIRQVVKNDKDYRVRISAVRALRAFGFKQTQPDLINALADSNTNVAVAASEVMVSLINEDSWKAILPICRTVSNGRVRANLFAGVLSASHNKEVAEEISRLYRESKESYNKAALLSALSHSVMSFGVIEQELLSSKIPIITTAAANALVAINYHKNFEKGLKEKFAAIYIKAIDRGDPAVIAIVCSALSDSTLGYKDLVKDITFLTDARKKLSLPKHIESIQPLEAAIAYFQGVKDAVPPSNKFNHPINWEKVSAIPHDLAVSMSTSKGEIIMRLYVDEAPGSVENFVSLVEKRYYDDKFFHRVVPNFVVQAGCDRGDGFGSEDHSIRSEFSARRYATGSLGMASAGKDTEGTQWFITHSPTPHLDGSYSIFGEVVRGMDVVHNLEVGDKILKIDLIK